jgi:hypothetical protein
MDCDIKVNPSETKRRGEVRSQETWEGKKEFTDLAQR